MSDPFPVNPTPSGAVVLPDVTGKSSDAAAPVDFEPMNARAFQEWMKGYESWLTTLRTHFYDIEEGYLGPEGDPLRLSFPMERCAVSCACVECSRRRAAAVPAAAPFVRPVQLSLL